MELWRILVFLLILIFSGIASFQDIKEQKVWNFLIFGGIFFVFLINLLLNRENLLNLIFSSLVYGIFYFVVKLITKGKLGNADIYFGVFQGICLDVKLLPICVLVEVILALVILHKRLGYGYFAFIPFMSGGLIISYSLQCLL